MSKSKIARKKDERNEGTVEGRTGGGKDGERETMRAEIEDSLVVLVVLGRGIYRLGRLFLVRGAFGGLPWAIYMMMQPPPADAVFICLVSISS